MEWALGPSLSQGLSQHLSQSGVTNGRTKGPDLLVFIGVAIVGSTGETAPVPAAMGTRQGTTRATPWCALVRA